jgi:acetolactate synthase I/II/III large subunit
MTTRLADYVAQFISQLGVNAIFFVSGGGNMFLADAIGNNPHLQKVPHHHEQAAAIAAEAYGRFTEDVGVALVTTGPGGTNAITGVAGAWIDSSPMLIISGQVKRPDLKGDTGVRQMGPQEVDIVSMVKPVTKYAVTVMDPMQIRYHLEEAVYHARNGRRGPVWVDIPLDVQAAPIDVEALESFVPPVQSTQSIDVAEAGARKVLEMIASAKRPLLLAGHGVRQSGAARRFVEFVERLNIPVATTWLACDLFPTQHPLSVGRPGTVAQRAPNFVVQNCDLLIAIGARLDNVTTAYNPAKFGRNARKVLIDVDPHELAKLGDAIDVKIEADAKMFIEAMLRIARDKHKVQQPDWLAYCQDLKARFPINDGKPFSASGIINHYHLTSVLADEVPEDTLFVTGSSGLAVEVFYTSFTVKRGQRIFLTSGLGAMGYSLPALIGAGIANDRKPFVAMESDGSLMMNSQELSTIASQNLPVRLFVYNNGGYASIRNTQRTYFQGRFVGTGPEAGLQFPDIAKLAEVHGIPSITVSDAAHLRDTVRSVMAHKDGPILCNVMLNTDEVLQPKSSAMPQADGSMLSMPLEDMTPLLSLEDLEAAMLVPLDKVSLKVRK